ncbi:Kinesin family member 11 [Heracleum sosnowskyi]|uniref:Kinesin family member 11 n=1 Tax=Heracleum sosnowskyi TaxID=360622 RepID=A0AAD8MGC5_9APIA|nr:Kinesin family member 11 [Heracleum sosnowskyi]KAK1371912.1 Kinesin family member 11 [Heracleum sosnowskyi]
MLKAELDKKMQECQKMAEALVEMERRKMEERILQQQEELELLRHRLKAFESQDNSSDKTRSSTEMDGSSFARKLLSMYTNEDPGMEKSMDLDNEEADQDSQAPDFAKKSFLSTVYEEDEEDEDDKEKPADDEVHKEVIEEKIVRPARTPLSIRDLVKEENHGEYVMRFHGLDKSSRLERIHNIFTLCGNYREMYQHSSTPYPTKKSSPSSSPTKEAVNAPAVNLFSSDLVASGKKQNVTEKIIEENFLDFKENCNPLVTPL